MFRAVPLLDFTIRILRAKDCKARVDLSIPRLKKTSLEIDKILQDCPFFNRKIEKMQQIDSRLCAIWSASLQCGNCASEFLEQPKAGRDAPNDPEAA